MPAKRIEITEISEGNVKDKTIKVKKIKNGKNGLHQLKGFQ